MNAQKRENIFSKFKAQDETEVKHNTAQKKKSQRNINKRDTYTGEICCRAEEKKIEYALWIDTEIADDNLTSSHDNLFSQHFLTFIVSLYLCLYLFCSAVCYVVLLLGLFFCSHRDLLITVFCAGKLMFVQKAWTWEKRRERETVKKNGQIFCQIFLKNRNVFFLLFFISSFLIIISSISFCIHISFDRSKWNTMILWNLMRWTVTKNTHNAKRNESIWCKIMGTLLITPLVYIYWLFYRISTIFCSICHIYHITVT